MKNLISRVALAGSALIGTFAVSMPAFAQDAIATSNPYGIVPALRQGGLIAQVVFGLLVIMSLTSWYIIFTKWWDQRKLMKEGREIDKRFWTAPSLKDGAAKLNKNSAYRQIVEDGVRATEHHEGRLTDKIDQNEWVTMSLARSTNSISARLQRGLAWLASVGSTAPFVGLFGTVVGIYRALINIGVAGQASIDKVAGPVGEALIMTALGLAVAVPAVLGYNWLIRRNKNVQDNLNNFSADVHGFLMSGARVRPVSTTSSAPTATATTASPSGSISKGEAVRPATGPTSTTKPRV